MRNNRVALVTGSGKHRVGWFVAEALARRGYELALHYRSSAAEAAEGVEQMKRLGVEAVAFRADVGDEADVTAMVNGVVQRFGRLDVLVNCAALWQSKPLEEVTADDVRRHFDANVMGTFLCCRHAGLVMTKQPEGGVIVNVGDWAEVRPYLHYSAYFASKGAIPTLTRMMAVELASRNPRVRVNAILPGPVMMPPELPEEVRREAIEATLVKREGSPANVAQAVLAFIDNDFVTAACLAVDGGRSVWGA